MLIRLALITIVTGCGAPDYQMSDEPRGEVNGRSFEFVSTKPDGTEWTFRVRGNSLWVGYVEGAKVGELGSINLSGKERAQLWKLIDMVDVGGRKQGRQLRRVVEIRGYTELSTVGPVEEGRRSGAGAVRAGRTLHLDHGGARIGEPRRAERRCHRLLDGDDDQSLQRLRTRHQ